MGIKVGVVGIGTFSDDFIRLFKMHPDVDDVILCDLVEERVKKSLEKHSLTKSYPDFDEMLKDDSIDSVAVFTQRHLHGPMVVKALKAGKHVYSAVPIACEIDEIKEVIETVNETRKIYMMGETCYYYPCAIYCRKKYKEGGFGKFVYGESQYYHDISEMYADFKHSAGNDDWRKPAGIPPMFYPTHSISMLLSALPEGEHITKVSCFGYEDHHEDAIYGEGKNYWDNPFSNETALFKLSGGGVIRINEFRRVGINKPSSYITAFYGQEGSYECSVTQHTFQRGAVAPDGPRIEYLDEVVNCYNYIEDKKAGTMDMTKDPCSVRYILGYAPVHDVERLPECYHDEKAFNHFNSHPFLVDDFVKAVVTGKLPPNNAWDAARYMIPGLVAHESALKGGVTMDVPDFGDAPSDWERLFD
ncbi:MAG: Gfo/Idh/MocA family oxidoreductase [Clostridia bacterium]|nr:Gfo/Idh/MocA family oxidoreductase [Clostridia bacterium]